MYRRANLDVSLLRNESRLDWLPKAACGVSVAPSLTPPPEPADRRPEICPWNVRRLEIPRGNFVPAVGETVEYLDVPEVSPDLFRRTQCMKYAAKSLVYFNGTFPATQ